MAVTPRKKNDAKGPSTSDMLKLVASAISALFAFYNVFFGNNGNAVAFATTAIILAADVFRLNYPLALKGFFENGSGNTRLLLLMIAIGGTLLSIDVYSEISLIPPYVDTMLKRLGPALVIVTLVMFATTALSDAITHTSLIVKDKTVIKYAPVMYLTAFLLCVEFLIVFSGFGSLDDFASCKNLSPDRFKICIDDKEKYKIATWNSEFMRFQVMTIAITAIWYFYAIGCIATRIVEYYLKEKILDAK